MLHVVAMGNAEQKNVFVMMGLPVSNVTKKVAQTIVANKAAATTKLVYVNAMLALRMKIARANCDAQMQMKRLCVMDVANAMKI